MNNTEINKCMANFLLLNFGNIATGAFMKCHEFRIKQPYEERQTVVIIDI